MVKARVAFICTIEEIVDIERAVQRRVKRVAVSCRVTIRTKTQPAQTKPKQNRSKKHQTQKTPKHPPNQKAKNRSNTMVRQANSLSVQEIDEHRNAKQVRPWNYSDSCQVHSATMSCELQQVSFEYMTPMSKRNARQAEHS